MKSKIYLAADLGATSGRVMAGHYNGQTLRLEEVHRFDNEPIEILDSLRWNITQLFADVRAGLEMAVSQHGKAVVSAGVDTWGVDYGLFGRAGELLGIPFAYRDPRTTGMPEYVHERLDPRSIYRRTGIQSMFLNTLYQLVAEQEAAGTAIAHAERLLFMPDIMNYWLTGVMANERTIASTSQLYDPAEKTWSHSLIEDLGLRSGMFHDLVDPGFELGPARLTQSGVKVVAAGGHDTASAVAAVPLSSPHAAYVSSGTWSLAGVEAAAPVLTDAAAEANFTNETGVAGRIRLLKNVTGMWLLEQSKKQWDAGRSSPLSYAEIDSAAERAGDPRGFIDPDHPSLATPGDMPARIRDLLPESARPGEADFGAPARLIYESLALKYRYVFESLEALTGDPIPAIHIVGGGSRNRLLNRMVADATGKPVVAGPVEATSFGNILVQMQTDGEITSLEEGRQLVSESVDIVRLDPEPSPAWNEKYQGFLSSHNLGPSHHG